METLRCLDFDKEQDCIRALFYAKWPTGFRCPRCGHQDAYHISTRRLPLFECKSCRRQTSLIAGTIMEGSRTPLVCWFKAIHLHSSPDGINALQLSVIIGVTYKTAWLICHKIRHAMSLAESRNLLTGWVKVSNAILSQRASAKFAWAPQEQSLLIAASRDQSGVLQIKMEKQKKESLRHKYALPDTRLFVRRVVAPEAIRTVRTAGLISSNRNQKLIQIAREAGRQLARQFRGIGPKHLQVYLNQICYGRNRQNVSVFNLLLSNCAQSPTITYPMLIGRTLTRVFRRVPRHNNVSLLAV